MNGITLILLFLVFTVLGIPIAYSLGLSSIIYFLATDTPLTVLAHRLPNALNSFPLVAVPVFIFAGSLMNSSGITDRLFKTARIFVGRQKGGLAHVNILASLIFSGISGAALADIGGLGKIEIKAMKDQGYDLGDAAAITAASATIGPIFPPSIPLIIFASVAEVSGVKLLIAGVIPALILTVLLMGIVSIIAHMKQWPADTLKPSIKESIKIILNALPALITPIVLIGGLLSGWFSPTEIAAVTAVYSLILGFIVYREMNLKDFYRVIKESIHSTAQILMVVAAASVYAWILTIEQVPAALAKFLLGISTNPIVLLLMVNVLLLFIGMIMDTIAAILVITPIIYPVLIMAGVDPIHLGIVVVFNLMIGLLTPPIGMSLYMVSCVANHPIQKVIRRLLPYFVPLLIVLLIITLFPTLSTWLPNLVFAK